MQKQIIKITSVNNEKIKYFYSLLDKKIRNKEKKFLIEGYHLVDEATKTSNLNAIISSDEKELSKFKNVQKYLVTDEIIKKLSNTKTPQKILGVVEILNNSVENLLVILANKIVKLVILDEINDPGNLGTIIRTAAALGYDAVIMSKNTVDLYNDKVIRATQGVLFKIPIFIENLNEIIPILKKHNIKCFGTALKNSIPFEQTSKVSRFAICLGNEARGISNEILQLMDQNIRIEMKNDVESLNVSVAGSIIMYEFSKKD